MSQILPKISIVTPCYNSTKFINRLHESLLNQDYKNFEWILVDDLSTDGTVDLIKSIPSPGEGGIFVYKLPLNSGGGVALGFGVARARGEILLLIDHDDELVPSAFSTLISEWAKVEARPSICGIFYPRLNPLSGQIIGERLEPGTEFSMSWQANTKPSITDGFVVFKTAVARDYFNPKALEAICLSGVPLNLMTKKFKLLAGVSKPLLIYHRDNSESQTNLVRVSRKTVYTYARYIDSYDRYYLQRPFHWIKHMIALIKFSLLIHGDPTYHHRFLESKLIRFLSISCLPAGILSYMYSKRKIIAVDLPAFDLRQLDALVPIVE